ncbi:MAG: putative beta-ribofuranosylaminobenzene 5-phosphate synthase [Firmicutes bacterium]|nr:putative beta-ribofuranosylaminobenzene 5-phosphate synthase [Bacillota bacterium]
MIHVQTPCRLHLGIFNLAAGGYGGIGVAIDRPNVRLTVARAGGLSAGGLSAGGLSAGGLSAGGLSATGPQSKRALQAAELFRQAYRVQAGAEIVVASAITPHVGLGSGTQIALAAAAALARLWRVDAPIAAIATVVGRGARSRIGLQAFLYGGFVAHATWRSGETATRVAPFPASWHWVVAAPLESEGLSGQAEATAFAELPPMGADASREARDLVELEILPGVQQADLPRFGRGLMSLQAIVGDYFAPVQGGRYAHPLGEQLAAALLDAGCAGVGQSSWGPSICGVIAGESEAQRALAAVMDRFGAAGGLRAWVAAPDNHGTRWG